MSTVLTPAQTRFLRGMAHGLRAMLQVGGKGVTDNLVAELDLALEHHELVKVIQRLAPRDGVELVSVTEEDEYFPPPRNLRQLQNAIETAATAMLGGSRVDGRTMDDRRLSASAVLTSLADN